MFLDVHKKKRSESLLKGEEGVGSCRWRREEKKGILSLNSTYFFVFRKPCQECVRVFCKYYKHIPYKIGCGNFLIIWLTTQLILAATIIVAVF